MSNISPNSSGTIKPTVHDLYKISLFRRVTASFRALPDYLIIGAQKAGTTTVYDNLIKHPGVLPCDIKEVHFFDRNWKKGVKWYKAHFPYSTSLKERDNQGNALITGEGSPYYLYHPLVPERVKQTVPNTKFIVVLRNPVERAYSHYQHEVRKGREPLSFEEAIEAESRRLAGEESKIISNPGYLSFAHQHHSYVSRGFYATQLKSWFKVFPKEQFFILTNEDLANDFSRIFEDLQAFLGLPTFEIQSAKRSNVGNYNRLDEVLVNRLSDIYREPNKELEGLLNRQLNWD